MRRSWPRASEGTAGSEAPAEQAGGSERPLPPVLCYHKVERRWELGVTRISPRCFARQIATLARDGWRAMSLASFAAYLRGERVPAVRELLVTFDDAYRGLREHAFPVLADAGFPATCFVITDYAGRLNRWDVAYGGRRFAHLGWRDIERWATRGIDFGSHTATHRRLPWLDAGALGDELRRSAETLGAALGALPAAVAYPFGAAGPRETEAAADHGYTLGFALSGPWRGDPLRIPRTAIYCWSPRRPGVGPTAGVERGIARLAGRFAIGTTLWQRLTGRL